VSRNNDACRVEVGVRARPDDSALVQYGVPIGNRATQGNALLDKKHGQPSPLQKTHEIDELIDVSLPAVSSIGDLRTPAPVNAASPSWGRHPKNFTQAVGLNDRLGEIRTHLLRRRGGRVAQ
jgi:hypothetical protein